MAESIFYYLQTVFCYTFFPHRCYFYMASDFMLHTILHLERLVCHIYSIVCLLLSLFLSLSYTCTPRSLPIALFYPRPLDCGLISLPSSFFSNQKLFDNLHFCTECYREFIVAKRTPKEVEKQTMPTQMINTRTRTHATNIPSDDEFCEISHAFASRLLLCQREKKMTMRLLRLFFQRDKVHRQPKNGRVIIAIQNVIIFN